MEQGSRGFCHPMPVRFRGPRFGRTAQSAFARPAGSLATWSLAALLHGLGLCLFVWCSAAGGLVVDSAPTAPGASTVVHLAPSRLSLPPVHQPELTAPA